MSSESGETRVGARGGVTVPDDIRDRLDIEEGDKLRWRVTDEGDLEIEIVRQREGVFDDAEAIDIGDTDAVEVEQEFGDE